MTVTGRDTTERLRDCADVRGFVRRVCFKTGPPGLVGAELEWLVAFADHPEEPVPIAHLQDLLHSRLPLPHGSSLTFEPGGQLELSSAVYADATSCWAGLLEDATIVRSTLAAAGLALLDTAIDPARPPARQLRHPRYDAMESYFSAVGDDLGAVMMTSTASVQVNLDIGVDPDDAARRWHLLHTVGPTMIAMFANSPIHAGRVTGWKSTRQRVWQGLDRVRTAPPAGQDPETAWTDYVLAARVMLEHRAGDDWRVEPGPTFRDWLERPEPPTPEDLTLHMTTLFPPVRPRGWFEVRYLDAQPWRWWPVPMAVLSALLDDPLAARAAAQACAGRDDWAGAARDGLAAPGLQDAALGCLDAAVDGLTRRGEAAELVARVTAFRDTHTAHRRSPADDLLEAR